MDLSDFFIKYQSKNRRKTNRIAIENMIAIEKSLPEETKKNFRRCPGEKSCEMIKTSSLSLFFQINLIKNVGTNLKTGVSFCLF